MPEPPPICNLATEFNGLVSWAGRKTGPSFFDAFPIIIRYYIEANSLLNSYTTFTIRINQRTTRMSKSKTAYFCQHCGYESVKWIGQCPGCQQWNSFLEEPVHKEEKKKKNWREEPEKRIGPKTISLSDVESKPEHRIQTPDTELNRVLGGGIVSGSLVLVAGEPGIGKSTLLLQMAIEETKIKVLYVSGEESEQQIRMRAERIGLANQQCFILTETNIQNIFKQAEETQPELMIIDSIQTLYSRSEEAHV